MVLATDALAGKVAVVTGGGTGIGAGICEALARAGAKVVVSPHQNVDGAERTAAGIRHAGATALVQACDVRDFDQVQALFDTTRREFGGVDILVNNAGITEPRPLLEMTVDEWDRTLNINLRGMFLCTQRAAREMVQRGGGRIVNLSSVHGYGAVPHHAHYEASKGGINMFTKACAIELAPYDIQVNAIAPGAIEVERYAAIPGYDREEWGQGIPAGRVGWPDDIGPLAAFLCSGGASYITGQIIWVDGGMTSRLGVGRLQRGADQSSQVQ
ncbi:MAG TPA: glucose 1-dehydrogenase [Chloroflexota bacterium]|nr:glucose 1-dehydrogenase [Chloroflexota bacterium]